MKKKMSFKYFDILLFAGLLMLLGSCRSSETIANRVLSADVEALLSSLETTSYRIDIRSARPFNTVATQRVMNQLLVPYTGDSAVRINVAGDGNYLAMTEGIASASLPFFGEQRLGGGYYNQRESGINIDSEPQEYRIVPHKSKDAAVIRFTVDDSNRNTEHYDVSIMIFQGGNSEVSIFSSHRTQMEYSGILEFVEPADDQ